MSSTANRVVKNTGFLYAKMGITMFISLYTTRLILNSLGAADFGIFNIVGGAIAMLGFLNAAMAGATQRFMSYSEGEGNKKKQKSIFNISILLHFFIALAAGIALLIAGYFFFNGILNIPADRIFAAKVVYGCLIVSTMFTVMSVPYDAVLNAHENMKYYAIVGIIESLLKLSVALIVVYTFSDKLIVYGVLMACIPLITLTIMRIYCHKLYTECTIAPKKYCDKTMMKEMTSFAGWNFSGTIASLIGNYGNGILINHFFGVALNAAMGIGNQLNGQLSIFSNNMLKALTPIIVKKEGARDRQGMLQYSFIGCKLSFALLAFFAIPCVIETPFILKIWLKNVPEWTILFFRLQLLRTLLEQLTISLGTTLSAEGHIKEMNIISFFTNLLPLIILWFLFSIGFPPYWLYIVAILSMVVLPSIAKLYYCKKYCNLKIKTYWNIVLFPSVICALIAFMAGYIPSILLTDWSALVCSTACSFSTFTLCFYFIVLSKDEQEKLVTMIKKITPRKY